MRDHSFVLMYHRVCEFVPQTACWFARGTAVTPVHFAAQITWLREHTRLVTLDDALFAPAPNDSPPRCAITFDDGYRDALVAVRLGVPVTVFAVADHTGDAFVPIWFDQYYDLLHRARTRCDIPLAALSLPGDGVAPAIDDDLGWWVRGPIKESLQGMPPSDRAHRMDELAAVLDAQGRAIASDLYLSRSDLRALAAEGHCVGGHGATHTRLTSLDDLALARELDASQTLLDSLASSRARLFCYPDGARDARVGAATKRAGFGAACTVEPGVLTKGTDPFSIPRLLMRNTLPGGSGWPFAITHRTGPSGLFLEGHPNSDGGTR